MSREENTKTKSFKKCQSATFEIDGHTYTIGMNSTPGKTEFSIQRNLGRSLRRSVLIIN